MHPKGRILAPLQQRTEQEAGAGRRPGAVDGPAAAEVDASASPSTLATGWAGVASRAWPDSARNARPWP
eukprot:scaffold3065_cov389-Prasinococcus_capsulatus_cf.AAC.11